MTNRLTKIFTRTGDEGFTQLHDVRLPKDDLLIEALGNIDELNSCIGLTLSLQPATEETQACLTQVQQDLFDFGAEMHVPERVSITAEKVLWLEARLEAMNKTMPPLKEFVLPRGNPSCAACHVARTVCRRTERSLVRLHRQTTLANMQMLRYINRLSDLLFVVARVLGRVSTTDEVLWEKDR
jgi:cob(I)alamin adenosyltransferase